MDRSPLTPLAVLTRLEQLGSQPALTWNVNDERVELSGAVAAQWVNKIANLLTSEVGIGSGDPIAIDLPAHWRTPLWVLGGLVSGSKISLSPTDDVDVLISSEAETLAQWPDIPDRFAVPLPAMAMRWDGELPSDVIDGAGAVMSQGDRLMMPPPEPGPVQSWTPNDADPATSLISPESWGSWAATLNPDIDLSQRVAFAIDSNDRGPAHVCALTLTVWVTGGSVVLATSDNIADVAKQEGAQPH